MHPRIACLLLAAVGAACAAGLRSSDRALHVRSIPGVDGWNSPLFEVHMPPYAFEAPPLTATAMLMSGGAPGQGELWLMQVAPPAGPTRVWGRVRGLAPGARVTLHAHAYGDTREACNATGPPFYPDMMAFGSPLDWQLHGGATALGHVALGSVMTVDAGGELAVEIWDPVLALAGMRGVAGRALVLHAAPEDSRADPQWGHMKPGLACAVVALSQLPEQALAAPPGAMHRPMGGPMHGPMGGPMGGPAGGPMSPSGSMQGPGQMDGPGQMAAVVPDSVMQKDVEEVPAPESPEEVADDVPMTTPMAA